MKLFMAATRSLKYNLTSYFIIFLKKLTYVYFYESNLQDKSIYMVFTLANLLT
jgi:hypothetical protein